MPRHAIRFVLALLAGAVLTDAATAGELEVTAPWARATIGQHKVAAAYLTLVNHSAEDDRLIAVSTPAAKEAHPHSTIMEDGVMKMRPLEALAVAARSSVVLEPGGFHVMLMGLADPLRAGGSFAMTLTFEKAGPIEIDVPVKRFTAMKATDN